MNKLITKDTIKKVLEQYSKYKLSLSERGVLESISAEIADELRRKFTIEPHFRHNKNYADKSDT